MKNAIIAMLSILLMFFVLQALGAFNFGSFIEHDNRKVFAKERNAAVEESPTFNIGVVANKHSAHVKDNIMGLELAINNINAQGGILGKKVKLYFVQASNLPEHNSAIQELCMQKNIAVTIGPFHSDYIPSMRALSQYQALPLISSVTVFSDKLPSLQPENFITFFPPLEKWTESIVVDLQKNNFANILLLAPTPDSYGDIFATSIERMEQRVDALSTIYRINYQSPLKKHALQRVFRNYDNKNLYDAILFTGSFSDFSTFCELGKELGIKHVVYGSDDLSIEGFPKDILFGPLRLPTIEIHDNKDGITNYKIYLNAETIYTIKTVLEKMGKYDSLKLIEELYTYQKSNAYKKSFDLSITIKEIK